MSVLSAYTQASSSIMQLSAIRAIWCLISCLKIWRISLQTKQLEANSEQEVPSDPGVLALDYFDGAAVQ